jgi:hypothetical protein
MGAQGPCDHRRAFPVEIGERTQVSISCDWKRSGYLANASQDLRSEVTDYMDA